MEITTHSFKYKPTTAPSGTEDRVLACSHTTDDCHCVINASGQIGYYVAGVFTQIGTATVSLNEQYAFIIEHDDSGNGCIYLNGQKIGCATNFPTTAINQIGNFKTELKPETGRKPKVGLKPRAVSNIYTRPCCGIIDEYSRFNRALSASEVVDLSQSGTLSKVYTLADYKIALMADDGVIATTEKPRYKENWRSIWDADQRTSALPTAIASITVNGSYKSLATVANDAGIWTPTTNGTPAYNYYQAVESWRQMYFISSGGGTGFLLTANLAGDSDISEMSPTLEARQSALMFAEDALRSAVMIKRQSTAELTAVANANAYTDELEDALRSQTDHAIVFTTSASDPSTSWTAEEKLIHKGDYWRVDTSSAWKTWTGTTWGTVNDAQAQAAASAAASAASTAQTSANNAQEIANAKRRVFTTTPTSPYDVGDLWVAGSSGDIKRCIIARATGSYIASEWDIASKYTDDTTANLKSRTYIQVSAPSIGLNAGDYWLDSDDGYKPYVYKDGAWAVDQAMQTAINAGTAASNAQSTANAKTTLYGTLASAKLAAKTGDQFFYNSEIYVCTADLATSARRYTTKSYGNSATAPVQKTQTVSGSVLTEPLNFGDTYFNTTTKKFYTYTTTWVEDTATSNAVIAYAPKYLGRYYQSHPGAPNNGDWWLVYGLASSPITRGFWYNNNGTNTLVSTLGTEAQRKYKGSGLEDVLYASNNGYALTSGGVYDPVGIYGVSTMEYLAVNQAFIEKLFAQNITLLSGGSIKSSNYDTTHGFNIDGDTGRLTGRDLRLGETGAFMTTENGTFADGVGYTTGNYDAPANGDLLMSMNGAATFLGLVKTPILALCQRVLGIWNLRLAIYQHLFGTRIVATKSDGITEIGSIDFNDRSSPNGRMLIKATERMQLQTGAGLNMATTDSQSSFFKEVYSNTIAPVNWFPTNQHSDAYPIMTMGKVLDGSISFLVPNNNTYTRAARLNVGQYGTSKEVNVSVKLNKTEYISISWNIAVTDGITESYFSGKLESVEQTTTVTVNRICTFNYLEVYVALSGGGFCTAISTFTAYAPNTTGVTLVN